MANVTLEFPDGAKKVIDNDDYPTVDSQWLGVTVKYGTTPMEVTGVETDNDGNFICTVSPNIPT